MDRTPDDRRLPAAIRHHQPDCVPPAEIAVLPEGKP